MTRILFKSLIANRWTFQHNMMPYVLFVIVTIIALGVSTCHGVFQCDFDDPAICGFTQDTRDDLNFFHHSGSTPTPGTGPTGDHTSGSGHYMYLETTGAAYGSTARLISPRLNGTGGDDTETDNEGVDGIQVTFWVHMNGEELGSLRVLVMNATEDNTTTTTTTTATMQLVTSVEGVLGSEWVENSCIVPQPSTDFYIVFEANCGASSVSDIAIDDVTIDDDVVIIATAPPPLEVFNCTFEDSGMCGFTQPQDDGFNLVKTQSGANQNPHAMKRDHTLGNSSGNYMSVDAYRLYYWSWRRTSNGQSVGQVARFVSPMLAGVNEGEEPACLLFWYHMHGKDDIGEIKVFIKNETSEGLGDPVWYLSGERGNVWRAAEVRIEESSKFQIVFEFVAGNIENMAIDDVSLSRYECPGEHPGALEPSVNCDFSEAEICYYTHDPTANFRWVWTNRATDSRFTGPAQDHTRGDELGFYLHVDSVFQRPGSKARLMTPLIKAQRSSSCLEFWYHMYGSHIGRLNVYAKFNDSALPATPAWTLSGNQGNAWHRASFLVTGMTRDFVFVFEGVLGVDYRTDIAIDDVAYFPNSPCPIYPTVEPTPTVLPTGLPLDFRCNFEMDSCNFTQAIDDIMDWTRAQANYVQRDLNGYRYTSMLRSSYQQWDQLRGPAGDHTLQSPDGYYMSFWLQRNRALRKNDQARIMSPLLAASDQPRCLSFYMYKDGYQSDFLNVYIREYGETRSIDPAWARFWRFKRWQLVHVSIPPSNRPLNIIFEAVVPSSRTHFRQFIIFGIDDVTVETGQCPKNGLFYYSQGIGKCDFEDEGLCGYSTGPWVRNSGETPSKHTGPSADHTYGNASGHYMYFETSQPVRPTDSGSMFTPRMHLLGKQCLRFYYHGSGNDTRRLQVFLREPAQYVFTLLKSVEGKQKNAWIPVNVDIEVSGDFQIVFKAFAGRGYQGDIAVDDVIILPHPCIDLVTETSCNFELGPDSCGFQNSLQNAINWKWYDAIFGKNYPLVSQSTATNSFMYLSSSPTSSKDKPSELYSGHMTVSPNEGDLCLTLEYIIEGTRLQMINVAVEEKGGERRDLGTLSDKNMTSWKMVTWSLLSSHSLSPFVIYRIVISVSNPEDKAVVGIDNVVVSSAVCNTLGIAGYSAQKQQTSADQQNRSGMAAGVVILVLIIVAVIAAVAYIFRSRIRSFAYRCSQRVTEMSYKNHDVAFVNEEKGETVEIPSITHPELEPSHDTGASPTIYNNI